MENLNPTQNIADATEVQRIVNVLAAWELLHGHDEAKSLVLSIALAEQPVAQPQPEQQATEREPEPVTVSPDDRWLVKARKGEVDGRKVEYLQEPVKLSSANVFVGSVIEKHLDFYLVLELKTEGRTKLARLSHAYYGTAGRSEWLNVSRSGGWRLMGRELPEVNAPS